MNTEKLNISEHENDEPSAEEIFGPQLDSLYRPWSATPAGSPSENALVKRRFDYISDIEKDMVQYGFNDPEFKNMAPLVEVAHIMRQNSRLVKTSESLSEMLFPDVEIPVEIQERDKIGLALPHELLYVMKEKGMKSKELGKVAHLYGGESMKYAHSMHDEIMYLLGDLQILSDYLKSGNDNELDTESFKYAKTPEALILMEDLLTVPEGVQDVNMMDSPDHTYYRVASRDWTAPEGEQKIVMLKRKIRLGKIGDTELIMRTSFIVNLDENISSIDEGVLKKVKRLKYDEEWIGKVVSPEIGLVDEIGRLGLEDDPNSFVLISSTIYAKNDIVEAELAKKREKDNEEARLSFKALQAKLFHSPR